MGKKCNWNSKIKCCADFHCVQQCKRHSFMFIMLVDPNVGINIQGSSVILNVFCCTTKRCFQAHSSSMDTFKVCDILCSRNRYQKGNNITDFLKSIPPYNMNAYLWAQLVSPVRDKSYGPEAEHTQITPWLIYRQDCFALM